MTKCPGKQVSVSLPVVPRPTNEWSTSHRPAQRCLPIYQSIPSRDPENSKAYTHSSSFIQH